MPTCNLFETVHNIWLQQSKKSVQCLFIATSDDYVRAFRQSAFYKVYLNGGRCGKGPSRDELKLWRTSQFSDRCKWPTSSLNTPTGLPSLIGYFIWRVKKFLDPQNEGLT
jgi:hypothetical protein